MNIKKYMACTQELIELAKPNDVELGENGDNYTETNSIGIETFYRLWINLSGLTPDKLKFSPIHISEYLIMDSDLNFYDGNGKCIGNYKEIDDFHLTIKRREDWLQVNWAEEDTRLDKGIRIPLNRLPAIVLKQYYSDIYKLQAIIDEINRIPITKGKKDSGIDLVSFCKIREKHAP